MRMLLCFIFLLSLPSYRFIYSTHLFTCPISAYIPQPTFFTVKIILVLKILPNLKITLWAYINYTNQNFNIILQTKFYSYISFILLLYIFYLVFFLNQVTNIFLLLTTFLNIDNIIFISLLILLFKNPMSRSYNFNCFYVICISICYKYYKNSLLLFNIINFLIRFGPFHFNYLPNLKHNQTT